MQSPKYSPGFKYQSLGVIEASTTLPQQLLTPPHQPLSPNHYNYYSNYLNKSNFNSILINCSLNLLKIKYDNKFNSNSMKLFIVEILKRSKTSTQTLQLTNYYIFKLIKSETVIDIDAKKLFLGLLIIASKFNQDCNYSFKNWCLICGMKDGTSAKKLTNIEFKCLQWLNYETYLNGRKYDNWCKFLIIFGYDFIKSQIINHKNNSKSFDVEINWLMDISDKLKKWQSFFKVFTIDHFEFIDINFNQYFETQLDKKIFIQQQSRKRQFVVETPIVKRIRV